MNLKCQEHGCNVTLEYSGHGRPRQYCPEHARENKRKLDRARPNGGHKERTTRHYPLCCQDAQKWGVVSYGGQKISYVEWDGRLGESATYEFKTTVSQVGQAHVKPAKVQKCEQHKQWKTYVHQCAKRGQSVPTKHTPGIDQDEGHAFKVDISAGSGKCGRGKLSGRMAKLATKDTTPEVHIDSDGVVTERDIRIHGGYRITSGDRADSYFIPDRSLVRIRAAIKCGYDTELERLTRDWLTAHQEVISREVSTIV